MTLQRRTTDVLVIGAGQAGLAVGRALAAAGVECQLVERTPRVGDAWRRRFDSLVLFTPRELSALPDLSLSGDPNGYPPEFRTATDTRQGRDPMGPRSRAHHGR